VNGAVIAREDMLTHARDWWLQEEQTAADQISGEHALACELNKKLPDIYPAVREGCE
jgi:hypothetical protein